MSRSGRRRLVLALLALLLAAGPDRGARAQEPPGREAERIERRLAQIESAHREHGSEPIPLLERLLRLREATLGADHLEVATCLLRLARSYGWVGGYPPDKIEQMLQRALRIREAHLGAADPAVAQILDALGKLLISRGAYPDAEKYLRRGLAIRQAALGAAHPHVATSLSLLGFLCQEKAHYQQARRFYEDALRIRERAQDPHHLDMADALTSLGGIWRYLDDLPRAIALYRRALDIRKAALGPDAYEVGLSLSDLAWTHRGLGAFDVAQQFATRALTIYVQTAGPVHPQVATAYYDLGVLCADRGDYRCAEEQYQRALALRERLLPPEHPQIMVLLIEEADLYHEQAAFDRELGVLERALRIAEEDADPEHLQAGLILYRMVRVKRALGETGQADALLQRGLGMMEASFGPENLAVALVLDEMAMLRRERGDAAGGDSLLHRALRICQGPSPAGTRGRPLELGGLLHHGGLLAHDQGHMARASALYEQALAVDEGTLGPSAPQLAPVLVDLARLRADQGEVGQAVGLLRRAIAISDRRLRNEALAFSERRLGGLLDLFRQQEDVVYSLLAARPGSAEVKRLALATVLSRKGRSVDQMAGVSRAIYRSLPAADREQFNQLRGLRGRIAGLTLAGPGRVAAERHRQQVKDLEQQADSLEQDLARRSSALREHGMGIDSDDLIPRVAAALPADGLLLEVVQARVRPLRAPGFSSGPLRYLALTLSPRGEIGAVDLGAAEGIDAAVGVFQHTLADPAADPAAPARDFYRRILAPLATQLAGTRHLFLSLDGELGLVPFAAARDRRGYLLETYRMTYLTSGRDLLSRRQVVRPATDLVVVADPALGAVPGPSPLASAEPTRGYRLDGLAPLPGARQEAATLRGLFPTARVLLGRDASEAALLALHAPGVLHIATHGLFLEDADSARGNTRGFQRITAAPPDNPLLRSALVLAGAAAQRDGGGSPAGADGLATAMEIAGMDLWGTQLVVLSACDLGRGQVRRGDGVYGMRRAVMIAGAETLVTSLWKVNDAVTRDLMVAFYQGLLAGQDRVEAMRQSALQIYRRFPHPYYWAPFIVIGRGGPLRNLPRPS